MMRRFLRVIRITLFVIRFPFLFSYSLLGESWTGVLFGFHLLVHLKLWGFLFVYYVLFFYFSTPSYHSGSCTLQILPTFFFPLSYVYFSLFSRLTQCSNGCLCFFLLFLFLLFVCETHNTQHQAAGSRFLP